MIKLELDYKRLMDYQQVKINLNAIEEHFRVGDILLKEVNNILLVTKNAIDLEEETSFTKEDFDDMLTMRNTILVPIFQNASFAVEFDYYTTPTTTTTTTTTTEFVDTTTTTTTTLIP